MELHRTSHGCALHTTTSRRVMRTVEGQVATSSKQASKDWGRGDLRPGVLDVPGDLREGLGAHGCSRLAKEYGGQGPATVRCASG